MKLLRWSPLVLLLVVGGASVKVDAQTPLVENDYTYYSDGTFTTVVGFACTNCNCTSASSSTGDTSTSWRRWDRICCAGDCPDICRCQHKDANGVWQNIACPSGVC